LKIISTAKQITFMKKYSYYIGFSLNQTLDASCLFTATQHSTTQKGELQSTSKPAGTTRKPSLYNQLALQTILF
jgi:hypothetical protein